MFATLVACTVVQQARTLNVFAAASLKEAFTQIAHNYEASHPGLTVRLNFAGSQTLAAQINQGAPADVFASAAEKNLDDIQFDKPSHRIFVLNKLEIAVRSGQPGIRTPRDLAKIPNLVVADPAVPVGHYTENFFGKAAGVYGSNWLAQIRSHIVSREDDVKAVLAKVILGEADAGIVYVSDVATARGKVVPVAIPDRLNETVSYHAAIPTSSQNKDDAKHFLKFVLSDASQAVLEHSGFVSPTRPVSYLILENGSNAVRVSLPLSGRYPQATVRVADEGKREETFRGAVVSTLPWFSGSATATFVGADGYSQTISIVDLKSRKAVLVRGSDGNYQLIVPGLKPNMWVNWLRSIEVR